MSQNNRDPGCWIGKPVCGIETRMSCISKYVKVLIIHISDFNECLTVLFGNKEISEVWNL